MSGRRPYIALAVLAAVGCVAGAFYHYACAGRPDPIEGYKMAGRPPHIRPDYTDTVIPPNIAPLNFHIEEPGAQYAVTIRSANGAPIMVRSNDGRVRMPLRRWKRLLSANRGEPLHFDVRIRSSDGAWRRFQPITNRIAREDIDGYLVYRQHNVMYSYYERMTLRQRRIENFDESLLLDNASFDDGCMNCHTFLNGGTERMILQVRSGQRDYGSGMLLIADGVVSKVNARPGFNPKSPAFASWHPRGRAIAFSVNTVMQFFHPAGTEVREGIDMGSDLAVYRFDVGRVTSSPEVARPDRLETWPAWAPDGQYLYFCSAPLLWAGTDWVPPEGYDRARYDLMRVRCDLEAGQWGEPEVVLASEELGLSISQPRFSPDGRLLIFCGMQHGMFPIFDPGSDLYLLDMQTRDWSRMACNSERSESWHSWSSNGRWIAFSSKRGDGLFIKVYFSYVDADGTAHKAFVLPQKDPDFYQSFIRIYHLPELVREPVPVRREEIAGPIRSARWAGPPATLTGATPRAGSQGGTGAGPPAPEPWTLSR